MPFDPAGALPGAPHPWASSTMPEVRGGPPYVMTEMISAEPALAERLVERLSRQPAVAALAGAIREAAAGGRSVITTGCGTSEHAAVAVAAFLADALHRAGLPADHVASVQAFELARRVPDHAAVIAVSHEGGTWATNLALERARAAGALTGLITVSDRSPGAALAENLLLTEEQDQSWCHTVGYLSPLVAGTLLAAEVAGESLSGSALRTLLTHATDEHAAEDVAAALAGCDRLLLAGSGVDHGTARELALKIEEGARLPATAHQLETLRHGHLAAADERAGLILVLTDAEGRGSELARRAEALLRAAEALGMPAAAIVAADLAPDLPAPLTRAGRLICPVDPSMPRMLTSVNGSVLPLQLLAERMARRRGVNPDTLGREDPRQAAAGDA